MSKTYNLIKKDFQYIVLEGSAYEVGRQHAEILKKENPEAAKWAGSASLDPKKMGFDSFEDLQNFYEEYCPGITEEISGFADGLNVKPNTLQIYNPNLQPRYPYPIYYPGSCSHIALLSSATKDRHVYVGRSFEYHHDPISFDFRLCTARIKGKVKHIGFTSMFLGRNDGMNDHGLCVTLSAGGVSTLKKEAKKRGFCYDLIVRTLLDNCRSVSEAVNHLQKIPVFGFWNFIVADKDSNAALFQYFDGKYDVKQIDKNSDERILFITNHYVLPKMVEYLRYAWDWGLQCSKKRYELIEATLGRRKHNIGKQDVRELFSKEMYDGLCMHYYTDHSGTLFSIIFDLSDLKAEICFGAPTHNKWQKPFTLDDPIGIKHFPAVLPDKSMKLDTLWDENLFTERGELRKPLRQP